MAFERLRTNESLDRGLGKPPARADVPWVAASAKQDDRETLRKKAKLVQVGQAMWTRDEIHKLLADWVLSNG